MNMIIKCLNLRTRHAYFKFSIRSSPTDTFYSYMSEDGVVTVKNLWLKKVWEICRPMLSGKGKNKTLWPLNLQIKQNVVHKIRPAKWYGKVGKFKTFECVEDFLSAVEETTYKNKDTRDDGPSWLDGMLASYEAFYGEKLRVPRWYDVEDKYFLGKK